MAWTLAIKNGDIYSNAGNLATTTGTSKMIQELRCWLLSQMGSNPYQPAYGSLLEGGIKPNGVVVESPIGIPFNNYSEIENFISAEIQRIVSSYQNIQNERIKEDQATYNKITLVPSEILKSLDNIEYEHEETILKVHIHVKTMENQTQSFSISVES